MKPRGFKVCEVEMPGHRFRIEAIPNFASGFYALIARKAPFLRDIHEDVAQEVCAKISAGRILDVGTGPGYLPLAIAKRNPDVEVTGIDLSRGMIDIARKNAEAAGVSGRVKFETANASKLPFADGYFDFVVSTMSLHHWSDPAACFQEIYRVLKDNATACVYDLRRDTTEDVNAQVRRRYGRFLSFVLLTFVRSHSSMTLKQAEDILSSLRVHFSKRTVEGQGIVLKLELLKYAPAPL